MANILIVDDSRTSRKILRGLLEREGHTVVAEATNGQEGYDLYAQHRPNLVTMDITMPVLNGVESLKKIIADFYFIKTFLQTRNLLFLQKARQILYT